MSGLSYQCDKQCTSVSTDIIIHTLGLTEPRMGLLLLLEPGVLVPALSPVTWLSEADFFMLEELEAPASGL